MTAPDAGAPDADARSVTTSGGDGAGPAPAGFRELFTEQFGAAVALARLLGSDDPEDTAQESFLRLHARWESLRDPAAAIGYLRRTVVNLCRNRIRHLMVVRRHAPVPDRTRAEWDASAEAEAMDRQRLGAVLAALSRLPARQREAIVLRYWMDLPFSDIAATLRCPAATARSHVRRGMASLAPALAGQVDARSARQHDTSTDRDETS